MLSQGVPVEFREQHLRRCVPLRLSFAPASLVLWRCQLRNTSSSAAPALALTNGRKQLAKYVKMGEPTGKSMHRVDEFVKVLIQAGAGGISGVEQAFSAVSAVHTVQRAALAEEQICNEVFLLSTKTEARVAGQELAEAAAHAWAAVYNQPRAPAKRRQQGQPCPGLSQSSTWKVRWHCQSGIY